MPKQEESNPKKGIIIGALIGFFIPFLVFLKTGITLIPYFPHIYLFPAGFIHFFLASDEMLNFLTAITPIYGLYNIVYYGAVGGLISLLKTRHKIIAIVVLIILMILTFMGWKNLIISGELINIIKGF